MPGVVVFDTNILVSALLSVGGNPFRCLALAKVGVVQSVTCQEILGQFQTTLEHKFAYSTEQGHSRSSALTRKTTRYWSARWSGRQLTS